MSDEVRIFPIVEWTVQSMPAGFGVISFIVFPLPDPDRPLEVGAEITPLTHHLGIGADECEQLAQDLLAMATRLREKRKNAN